MKFLIRTFMIFACLMAASHAFAEADPLFRESGIIEARLTGPLTTLIRERPKDEYLPAKFEYADADGAAVTFDIQIRARGNFRHETCDYPPVRLNFKKGQTKGTLFDKQDKVKLVVHCGKIGRYEQIVLREYLTYRILNELTPLSFRVRLLLITYEDTDEEQVSEARYAFLIEHKARLAKRIGINTLDIKRVTTPTLDGAQLSLTSLFQYMIGNTDFSPVVGPAGDFCCHNYVLFQNESEPITPIPYDFDQAGFVNAPYAEPNPQFRIRSVRQRVFRGRCVNNEHIPASVEIFKSRRNEIMSLIESQEGLSDKTREAVIKYANSFFKIIDVPKDVERFLVKRCIGAS